MSLIEVWKVGTKERRFYGCSPEAAVIAAYAQERGDWNTWDYADRYTGLVEWGPIWNGRRVVTCGDWSTLVVIKALPVPAGVDRDGRFVWKAPDIEIEEADR